MPRFSYIGKYRYALVFRVFLSRAVFISEAPVNLVREQVFRSASGKQFEITAYCFMPDHVHLLAEGLTETSSCKDFIRAAKQYSGYCYARAYRARLWERYCYEHVIRDDFERAATIKYIVDNPVAAGLVENAIEYPFVGSQRYTLAELILQSETSG